MGCERLPSYRPEMDGLRAIAILPVIAFHVWPKFCPTGYLGADIFFVIPGYLVTGVLLKNLQANSLSLREFWIRPAKRLFPAMSVVMSVSIGAGWFVF